MTTMELTYEAAQTETARLQEQQQVWTEKRAQLQAELEEMQANATEAALAGVSTSTIAERISQIQMEIPIAGRALQALEGQQKEAKRAEGLAYTEQLRQQVVDLQAKAAALRAEAEPHFQAIERIQGVRPWFQNGREFDLEMRADMIQRSVEERDLQFQSEGI